jgi:hypothetical protein
MLRCMQRQLKLIAPLLLSSLFVCAETFSAAFSGSEPLKATSRASVTPKMSGAFQPGSAPPQNFFRDVIYQQSAASGTVVPWDVGQAQPALATAREIFKGSVLDVGTGMCGEFTLVFLNIASESLSTTIAYASSCFLLPPTIGMNSANSVTYGASSDRDGGQRALAVHAA